ncbi:MAG: hypothetical protein II934_08460 [Prevotella sp.]|nr:hypothetical protein [Prevotella sp.]
MGLLDKIKEQASNLQQLANTSGMINSQNSTPPSPPVEQHSMPQQNVEKNSLYGNYMEQLIEMALADGELTEKEKQVLFKKAEAAGIDLDEFEMVLDARLYEKQKAMQAPQPVSVGGATPNSKKLGDVRKCPACGAILESFITRCPDCGHEINGAGVVSSFNALISKLEEFDRNDRTNPIIGVWTGGEAKRLQKKKQIIANFPIPTTREDLLEFLSMGVPLAQTKGNFFMRRNQSSENYEHDQLSSAWKSKLEQVLMKARISMKDDKATLAEIEHYAQELKIK